MKNRKISLMKKRKTSLMKSVEEKEEELSNGKDKQLMEEKNEEKTANRKVDPVVTNMQQIINVENGDDDVVVEEMEDINNEIGLRQEEVEDSGEEKDEDMQMEMLDKARMITEQNVELQSLENLPHEKNKEKEKVKVSREEKYIQEVDELVGLLGPTRSTGYTATITTTFSAIFSRQLRAILIGGLRAEGIFGLRAWRA